MNYRDGKMLKISNSLDRYSSRKTKIQLHEKTKADSGKTDVENAFERSQNPEKYTRKPANRTREDCVRRTRARDHAP